MLSVKEQFGVPEKLPTIGYFGNFKGSSGSRYVGTPQHIAPELLEHVSFVEEEAVKRAASGGHAAPLVKFGIAYTTKCDIYSLGISFIPTLTGGAMPLGAQQNVKHIATDVRDGTLHTNCKMLLQERPRKLVQGDFMSDTFPVNGETIEFVLSMLELDPAKRPSAATLLASPYFDGIRAEAHKLFPHHEKGDVPELAAGGAAPAPEPAAGGAAAAPAPAAPQ